MMKKLIGGHVSTAGGLHLAMERAHTIGGNCAQIFSGSPRIWQRQPLEKIPTDKLFAEQKEYGVEQIYIHALYLTNLATENPELATKTVKALIYDLSFASHIKASGVIVHVGSHQGRGWDAAKEAIAGRLSEILANTPDDSIFLIENSAGQKGKVNSELAEIRWLMDQVKSPRLGWCLDTCHAFSAGYGFTSAQPGKALLVDEIEKYQLWDSLKVIHVNESKGKLGGGLDRHDNLGSGEIGDQALKELLTNKKLAHLPLLLEVPGFDGNGPDGENVELLKKLVS
jgi:deoxyribonuclease IV